ncbi:collagen alpha-2(I) chain-like isoform X3 [Chamaea fasciata]|uniref:collagen alpha-2(I) chain-like isoform X3 n=1 Tax=Chamaea fasciata TaxID=190680 RepID=UPI00336ACA35
MTQQETYGNWLGPKRLVRQPGIYSVAGKMSPLGDFRPASPDSFEDDYDDVSMAGSERGPPAKGVYLLAGPPGSSPAPSLKNSQDFEPKLQDLGPKLQDSDPKSANLDLKSGDLDPNWGVSRPGAWNSVTVSLLVLLGLSGLAWAALLGLGLAERAAGGAGAAQVERLGNLGFRPAGSDPAAVRDPPAPTGAAGNHRPAVRLRGQLPALSPRLDVPRQQLLLLLAGLAGLGPRPQRLHRPGRAPGRGQLRGRAGFSDEEQGRQQLLLAGGEGAPGANALGHRGGAQIRILGRLGPGRGQGAQGVRSSGAQGPLDPEGLLGIPPLDL